MRLDTDVTNVLQRDGDMHGEQNGFSRGNKFYFHRKGAPLPFTDRPSDSTTTMQPAKTGLGALLCSLKLHTDCAHKIGMAKGHGMGSFKITVNGLSIVNREARYRTLFREDGAFETGESKETLKSDQKLLTPKEVARWLDVSVDWVHNHATRKEPRLPVVRIGSGSDASLQREYDSQRLHEVYSSKVFAMLSSYSINVFVRGRGEVREIKSQGIEKSRVSAYRSSTPVEPSSKCIIMNGGHAGTRTPDLLRVKQAL